MDMGVFSEKKPEGKRRSFLEWIREKSWVVRGIAVSLVLAVVLVSFYGVFHTRAKSFEASPLENLENMEWLLQSCYLLYRDLYNTQNEESQDYSELYLKVDEKQQWLLDENQRKIYEQLVALADEYEWRAEAYEEPDEAYEEAGDKGSDKEPVSQLANQTFGIPEEWVEEYLRSGTVNGITRVEYTELTSTLAEFKLYFHILEESFTSLNSNYDYIIQDNVTGKFVTNMSMDDRNRPSSSNYFEISFSFNSMGTASVGDTICGLDGTKMRKLAQEATRTKSLANANDSFSILNSIGKICHPVDCTVTFAVSKEVWNTRGRSFYVGASNAYAGDSVFLYYGAMPYYYAYSLDSYYDAGVTTVIASCMLAVALLALILPMRGKKPWKDERICAVSFELLVIFACVVLGFSDTIVQMVAYTASGGAGGAFVAYFSLDLKAAEVLVKILNVMALTAFFFACWYVGICVRAVREYGMRGYVKRRSLIYRFFPFMKSQAVKAYVSVSHMDLVGDSNKTIIKLLIVNAVILFLISCMWIGGFAVTLVYSVVLYLILRKFISDLQKRYAVLLKAVDEIAEGNLNVSISEDLGVFEPFREQIFKIQDGLQKAVDTEVKSQRMKAELVTNMSHDLKTPLTAIITYVNLLKDENITEKQRREYLATLERKSNRLKSLIEDLFEFSRVNSNNITLNIMDVDIMNLVKQVCFEMSDKIDAAGLDVRMNLTDEKVVLPLDSQKTYRIYENLFGNIAKYAMPGTRFYVNGFRIDDTVVITLKNISMQEITVDPAELTERFVRGDASRNTEGSGLGLAIAKSFTELQGGQLSLEVDGDLFKVTTTWAYCSHDEKKDAKRI